MSFTSAFGQFPVLETHSLLLTSLQQADAEIMCRELQRLPRNTSWAVSAAAESETKARQRIGHHRQAFNRKQNIHWALRLKRGNRLVGVCKLFDFSYQFRAEIGYWVAKRHWGKGYATEAVTAAVSFAFDVLELHRVYAYTDATNRASQRVLEKAGFAEEGRLRQNTVRNGDFSDSLIYGTINAGDSITRWADRPWAT